MLHDNSPLDIAKSFTVKFEISVGLLHATTIARSHENYSSNIPHEIICLNRKDTRYINMVFFSSMHIYSRHFQHSYLPLSFLFLRFSFFFFKIRHKYNKYLQRGVLIFRDDFSIFELQIRATRKYQEWHEARISLRVLDKITSLFVIPVYRCARGNGTRPKERGTLLQARNYIGG